MNGLGKKKERKRFGTIVHSLICVCGEQFNHIIIFISLFECREKKIRNNKSLTDSSQPKDNAVTNSKKLLNPVHAHK